MGYPVFYSDAESKKILDSHPVAVAEITALFGSEAYKDTILNRPYIATRIFENETLRERLNAIAHPLVRKAFDAWKKKQTSDLVFNEAAILFETGAYKNFDFTILVTAPESTRLNRVLMRDISKAEEIKKRMKSQWSDEEKLKLATHQIINDDLTPLLPQVQTILKKLKS